MAWEKKARRQEQTRGISVTKETKSLPRTLGRREEKRLRCEGGLVAMDEGGEPKAEGEST